MPTNQLSCRKAGLKINIPGFYRIALAAGQVCLHVDDDNFVCELGNRQLGNGIKAGKGPTLCSEHANRAPLRLNPALITGCAAFLRYGLAFLPKLSTAAVFSLAQNERITVLAVNKYYGCDYFAPGRFCCPHYSLHARLCFYAKESLVIRVIQ